MGGDFSLMRDDSFRFNVARPSRVPLPSRSESFSDSDSRLKRFLGTLVEIVRNRPTCFHSPSKTESTIDRFCVSAHPSKLYLDHVSDHSPVRLVLSPVWGTTEATSQHSIMDHEISPFQEKY